MRRQDWSSLNAGSTLHSLSVNKETSGDCTSALEQDKSKVSSRYMITWYWLTNKQQWRNFKFSPPTLQKTPYGPRCPSTSFVNLCLMSLLLRCVVVVVFFYKFYCGLFQVTPLIKLRSLLSAKRIEIRNSNLTCRLRAAVVVWTCVFSAEQISPASIEITSSRWSLNLCF